MKTCSGIIKLRDYVLWRADAASRAKLEALLEVTYQARRRGEFEPEPSVAEIQTTFEQTRALMQSAPVGALAAYREGGD